MKVFPARKARRFVLRLSGGWSGFWSGGRCHQRFPWIKRGTRAAYFRYLAPLIIAPMVRRMICRSSPGEECLM